MPGGRARVQNLVIQITVPVNLDFSDVKIAFYKFRQAAIDS